MRPTRAALAVLPTPASGAFRLNLPLYRPAASALDAAWTPPGVERVG